MACRLCSTYLRVSILVSCNSVFRCFCIKSFSSRLLMKSQQTVFIPIFGNFAEKFLSPRCTEEIKHRMVLFWKLRHIKCRLWSENEIAIYSRLLLECDYVFWFSNTCKKLDIFDDNWRLNFICADGFVAICYICEELKWHFGVTSKSFLNNFLPKGRFKSSWPSM